MPPPSSDPASPARTPEDRGRLAAAICLAALIVIPAIVAAVTWALDWPVWHSTSIALMSAAVGIFILWLSAMTWPPAARRLGLPVMGPDADEREKRIAQAAAQDAVLVYMAMLVTGGFLWGDTKLFVFAIIGMVLYYGSIVVRNKRDG